VQRMIDLARALSKPVLVDPKGDDYSRYRGANVLTPNRSELREVVGKWKDDADLFARAQSLRASLALEALLVTRSEEGMTLFRQSGVTHEGTRALEVFDVSGAGDTVIATLAVMLAAGCDLADAMRLSNHAAGIVVGKLGTATVTLEELKRHT
jgi:D-glycero-beta-D-manno-heptose-7-phosphate kinase